MNWFTSDYHFNHDKIIDFCRPRFKSMDEMIREIIYKHNSRVDIHDTVYFLGDMFFATPRSEIYSILNSMNGNFVIIEGNHDKCNKVRGLHCAVINSFGKNIQIVHDPKMVNLGFDFYLVGHVHTNWKFQERMCNVGVDVWDFYPVHLKQILKAYNTWRGK